MACVSMMVGEGTRTYCDSFIWEMDMRIKKGGFISLFADRVKPKYPTAGLTLDH